MTSFKLSIALLSAGFFTLVVFAVAKLVPAMSDDSIAVRSTNSSQSVGGERNRHLVELSKRYVSPDKPASAIALKADKGLAPMEFLNEQLQQDGTKWRVRRINGVDAETYDVS